MNCMGSNNWVTFCKLVTLAREFLESFVTGSCLDLFDTSSNFGLIPPKSQCSLGGVEGQLDSIRLSLTV
ncbi:hypothetical protein DdX_13661 [Ditylenchus destructor]|uniref:Uncharacterized protein n=1 Tax=Ditylenchus destructor TaxID=166010 RepID=A0AAD4MUV7_9BILA|nr:hypothetical protein DdX_13661 [Ditylenchus destructor]